MRLTSWRGCLNDDCRRPLWFFERERGYCGECIDDAQRRLGTVLSRVWSYARAVRQQGIEIQRVKLFKEGA